MHTFFCGVGGASYTSTEIIFLDHVWQIRPCGAHVTTYSLGSVINSRILQLLALTDDGPLVNGCHICMFIWMFFF